MATVETVLTRTDLRRTGRQTPTVAHRETIARRIRDRMRVRMPSVKRAHGLTIRDPTIRGRIVRDRIIRDRTTRDPIVPTARLRDPMRGRITRGLTTIRVRTRNAPIIPGRKLSGRKIRVRSIRTTTGVRKTSRRRSVLRIDGRKTSRTKIHRMPTRVRETLHPRIAMQAARLQTVRRRNS